MTVNLKKQDSVRYLGVGGLAQRYDVSDKTIRRMHDRGELPAPLRIGRLLRWHPADIEKWEAGR